MGLRHLYIGGTGGTGIIPTGTEIQISKSWTIDQKINNRDTFSFTIEDANGATIEPLVELYFYDDTTYIWGGIIKTVDISKVSPNRAIYSVKAEDFTALTERPLIIRSYENKTIAEIINSLITTYFSDYGITEGTNTISTVIKLITFNYEYGDNVLNQLKNFGNFQWNVNKDKVLSFTKIVDITSTTTLTDELSLSKSLSADNYRNTQYAKGKKKRTIYLTEQEMTPKPDGKSREFFAKYPIAEQPLIETNTNGAGWVERTVGVRGLQTAKDFYWSYNDTQISQDENGTVLTDANPTDDDIRISYYGLIPLLVVSEKTSEVTEHGKVENYIYNQHLETSIDAKNYVTTLLDKYANDADQISFTIREKTYSVGEQIPIIDSVLNISGNFLAESCTWTPRGLNGINYNYKVLDGVALGGWEEFFKNLFAPEVIELNDQEIVIRIYPWSEATSHDGSYTITVYTPLVPENTLYPEDTLYPNTYVSDSTVND